MATPKKAAVKKVAAKKVVKKTAIKKVAAKKVVKKAAPKKTTTRKKTIAREEFCRLVGEKAYEFYVDRGYAHGDDAYDWHRAEQELNKIYKVK